MKQFSTGELVRRLGDVTHAAAQSPVTITQHRKPRFVMMSIEEYKFMRDRDPQRAYSADNTPQDVAEWLLPALDKIASGDFDYEE